MARKFHVNSLMQPLESESVNCVIAQYLNSVLEDTGIQFQIGQKATETSSCNMCTHLQETGHWDGVVSVAHDECFFSCCHVCQEQLCWIDVAIWHLFFPPAIIHTCTWLTYIALPKIRFCYFFYLNCHRMRITREVSVLEDEIVLQWPFGQKTGTRRG